MLFDISNAVTETLHDELFEQKQVDLSVLRLDKIHPVISGNKLFKLHYFLEEALKPGHKTILTFGGAYSNHLAATAFACSMLGIKSIGIVRGERPAVLSHTLLQCMNHSMQLKFISRDEFGKKNETGFIQALKEEFGDCLIIPEGGYHPLGAKGAALIMELTKGKNFSHVCTAAGTATTLAGLLTAAEPSQEIIAVPVLKGMTDLEERIQYLIGRPAPFTSLRLLQEYHFGGYAKRADELIGFMNDCWQRYRLPLDFVYTAKLFYGIVNSIKENRFPAGSRIICIHTGGLQGNRSLPAGALLY